MWLATILQNDTINEKIKNAPNDDYSTGILIGNLIPFVVLVIIAYLIYRYNKNKIKNE